MGGPTGIGELDSGISERHLEPRPEFAQHSELSGRKRADDQSYLHPGR